MNLYFIMVFLYLIFEIESKSLDEGMTSDISDIEYKLSSKLLSEYKKRKRPSATVQVRLAINSFQLIDIFEKDQIMVINCFIDQKWFDSRLKWGKDV